MANGNDGLTFDISDDHQFKTFVVRQLTKMDQLSETVKELKPLSVKVPVLEQEVLDLRAIMKDDKFWVNVKASVGPVLVVLHAVAKKYLGIL